LFGEESKAPFGTWVSRFRSTSPSRQFRATAGLRIRANNGSERSYSITSSAIASIVGGTVRPSVLAVLEVDRQLEFCGLHDRRVGRFLSLENAPTRECSI
jgi:hypothetical protein